MSAKQDRVYTRTASDLERKFKFGESFAEVMGIATDARKAAEDAKDAVGELDGELTQEEIFNRLTNNGQLQGIYRGDDGEIYINANYIKAGTLIADMIQGGILKSKDGKVYIGLDNGYISMEDEFDGHEARIGHHPRGQFIEMKIDGVWKRLFELCLVRFNYADGSKKYLAQMVGGADGLSAGDLSVIGDLSVTGNLSVNGTSYAFEEIFNGSIEAGELKTLALTRGAVYMLVGSGNNWGSFLGYVVTTHDTEPYCAEIINSGAYSVTKNTTAVFVKNVRSTGAIPLRIVRIF